MWRQSLNQLSDLIWTVVKFIIIWKDWHFQLNHIQALFEKLQKFKGVIYLKNSSIFKVLKMNNETQALSNSRPCGDPVILQE